MSDFIELLWNGFLRGLYLFMCVAGVILMGLSLIFTLWLAYDIIAGVYAPWFHIAAPFVLFFGSGIIWSIEED